MKVFIKIVYLLFCILALLLTAGSILSLFRDTPSKFLKLLDFPRIQFFLISLLFLLIAIFIVSKKKWWDYTVMGGLLCSIFIQALYLVHYTSIIPFDVPAAKKIQSSEIIFSMLITNVKMSNRNEEELLNLISTKKPDLILAMEINKWWEDHLASIEKNYPFSQKTINNLTYGMILYSKFPLQKTDVDYLNNKKVPSFECIVALPKGKQISLHAVHPVPPTNFEILPDNAGQNEVAMKKIGKKLEQRKLPTVVAGDINDVVWSHVDELTSTKNILHDVRVGRGFYNTYNAKNFLMRWPLDHIFLTKEFRLNKIELLPYIGSDHFPLYAELVL